MSIPPLSLVTLTYLVVVLPAASRAVDRSTCYPVDAVVVFHVIPHGFPVCSGAMLAPSSLYCTLSTPRLSHCRDFDVDVLVHDVTVILGAASTTFGGTVSTVDAAPGPGGHCAPVQARSLASCADSVAACGFVGGSLLGSPSQP